MLLPNQEKNLSDNVFGLVDSTSGYSRGGTAIEFLTVAGILIFGDEGGSGLIEMEMDDLEISLASFPKVDTVF